MEDPRNSQGCPVSYGEAGWLLTQQSEMRVLGECGHPGFADVNRKVCFGKKTNTENSPILSVREVPDCLGASH
jgi:hypothetical protein